MNRLTKINTAVSSPLGGSNLAGAVSPAPATLSEIGAAPEGSGAVRVRTPTGGAGAPNPSTSPVRVLLVPGEAFDADQVTLPCEQCGLNEYACECDDPWGYGPAKSREEIEANYRAALDRIARVFLGVGA